MTRYQATDDEKKIVESIAAKISELQLLFEQAAKNNIEVRFEPVRGAFSLFSPFTDTDQPVKPCRISWAAHKVQIERDLISGN